MRSALPWMLLWVTVSASVTTVAAEIPVESVVLKLIDEAMLTSQEAGVLTQLRVREGDMVARGDVLASIDTRAALLAVAARRAELAHAEAEAESDVQVRYAKMAREVAQAELARSQESNSRFARSVSQSQLDVERLTADKLTLEVEQAEQLAKLARLKADIHRAELASAELAVRLREVATPLAGMVVEVPAKHGVWVEPGQALVRVVNIDRLKAEGFVSAATPLAALVGAMAEVRVAGEAAPVTAKVVFVSPEIDPINQQVRVSAEVDNRGAKLRPGQAVSLVIRVDDASTVTADR